MTNAYADLQAIKDPGLLDITGTSHDSRLLALLEDVSRWIDLYCNRYFYVLVETRTFDGPGGSELLVPDLISVTSLRTDEDHNRTFETTWAATDYLLYPQNAQPTRPWGRPVTRIVVDSKAGTRTAFPVGVGTVEVVGKWGYREELETSLAVVGAQGIDGTSTSLTVDDGSQFSPGQTILIDSEQMYVTGVSANVLTVKRGVNGTTEATHAASALIQVYRYPAGVIQACLGQSARLWGRGRGGADSGGPGLEPEVRQMLSPYRRLPVGQGGGA